MTYTRRLTRNGHTYLYRARTFRDKKTGKVEQEVTYLGKEVEKDGEKILQPKIDRSSVRRVLDSAGYIMYRVAEEHGFIDRYQAAISGYCRIEDPAKKIVMLAAESLVGSEHSIHLHAGIPELKEKVIRDLIKLVGRSDPDTIALMERSIAPLLIQEYGDLGIVYDLSAFRYYGSSNDLAGYGHYYAVNGQNKEINFVLAVTRRGGIPVHHRALSGSIPSVSTIRMFSKELKDYGIIGILIVIDRGFYSADNLRDLKDYSVIGALPSSLSIHGDLILRSKDIDNSRNYFQYRKETIFTREERIHGTRYIVYFSPRLRSQRIESFYEQLAEKQSLLDDLRTKKFKKLVDLTRAVESAIDGFHRLIDIVYDKDKLTFSYELKHKAIQRRTNRFGYSILFTNTQIPAQDILRIYREKDIVEKAFSHVKPHLEPFFYSTEGGTRARLFLTMLGYTIIAIIADKCGLSYNQVMDTLSGIREVVYMNGSHAPVEYTKEQRELLENLKIAL